MTTISPRRRAARRCLTRDSSAAYLGGGTSHMAVAHKPVILLVDGDPLFLRAQARLLADHANLLLVCSAPDALRLLGTLRADAIVSDYGMPGINGIELLTQVRASQPATLRVLVSAGEVPNLAGHVASGLVEHFLEKPASLNALLLALALPKCPA